MAVRTAHQRRAARPSIILLRATIVGLTLATAAIHVSLGGTMFLLNALGYAVFAVAMVLPGPVARIRWLVRYGLIGFTAVTVGRLAGVRCPVRPCLSRQGHRSRAHRPAAHRVVGARWRSVRCGSPVPTDRGQRLGLTVSPADTAGRQCDDRPSPSRRGIRARPGAARRRHRSRREGRSSSPTRPSRSRS